jgi:hypothetical protein
MQSPAAFRLNSDECSIQLHTIFCRDALKSKHRN